MIIYRMLDLSTCHITKETNDALLEEKIQDVVYYQKPGYGFFIHIPECLEDVEDGDIPDDLFKCLVYALENRCDWINLDCDGVIEEDLPKYVW